MELNLATMKWEIHMARVNKFFEANDEADDAKNKRSKYTELYALQDDILQNTTFDFISVCEL